MSWQHEDRPRFEQRMDGEASLSLEGEFSGHIYQHWLAASLALLPTHPRPRDAATTLQLNPGTLIKENEHRTKRTRMIYSTNGFIDSSNDSSSGDPRIVELPSTSPYQGTLDTILGDSGTVISSDATQPIITSPAQPIITSPDLDASTLMPPPQGLPVRRSQLVLQQQQSPQSTANAAVALLSSLGPTATATSSSVQAANAVSGSKPSRSSQRGTTSTGIAQLPSSSSATSQSLQPLTRATIGSRGGNVAAFLTKSYK